MASRSPAPALAPPDCLERLRAAFAERDEVQSRLAAAEAEIGALRDRAAQARAAAERAAADVALGRVTDTEADALDTEAAAAGKAARHAERLIAGLRKLLADAEASIAAMAAPAREDLLGWARAHAAANLAGRYREHAEQTFAVVRELAALRNAADLGWGDDAPFQLPVDLLEGYGPRFRIGSNDGEVAPLATPASDMAAEAQALLRRAERLAEREER